MRDMEQGIGAIASKQKYTMARSTKVSHIWIDFENFCEDIRNLHLDN